MLTSVCITLLLRDTGSSCHKRGTKAIFLLKLQLWQLDPNVLFLKESFGPTNHSSQLYCSEGNVMSLSVSWRVLGGFQANYSNFTSKDPPCFTVAGQLDKSS